METIPFKLKLQISDDILHFLSTKGNENIDLLPKNKALMVDKLNKILKENNISLKESLHKFQQTTKIYVGSLFELIIRNFYPSLEISTENIYSGGFTEAGAPPEESTAFDKALSDLFDNIYDSFTKNIKQSI